jgi:4-hydroxy-3-methylbut-2-enyl diphosphate reductase
MAAVAGDRPVDFDWNDSICRQVSNRSGQLRAFASRFDIVIFVSGKKSSNGMILYQICKEVNQNTHLISSQDDLRAEWFSDVESVGICGATSTPMWLMEEMEREILKFDH